MCDRSDVYASGCALARAFPVYSRKTSANDVKTENGTTKANNVTVEFICTAGDAVTQEELDVLQESARAIQLSAQIVDTPCNEMHTDAFLEVSFLSLCAHYSISSESDLQVVRDVGKELGIVPIVIQGEELAEKGFGGIYGVGKAAVHQPALAVLSHQPAGATETVAWVGKGIVYDTGGLSIKVRLKL